MISSLVGLLIILLIIGVIWYAVTSLIPLPPPFGVIANLVLALILVLVLLEFLLPFAGIHAWGRY